MEIGTDRISLLDVIDGYKIDTATWTSTSTSMSTSTSTSTSTWACLFCLFVRPRYPRKVFHDVMIPYHHIVISSYHHIIIPSYHPIIISSYRHIIISSYHHIIILKEKLYVGYGPKVNKKTEIELFTPPPKV